MRYCIKYEGQLHVLQHEITHHFKHAPIMGWRLSLRTPARIMLLVSAAALTFFSKVALTQCDSHGYVMHLPWTIACLQTLGLGLCALPGVLRYAAAAMRAGRAVIASLGEEDSDPLDPTRYANALDYVRVALFGGIRCVACVLGMAGLQYLHISQYLCLKSLLFVFVSVASHFRRKNFFRYHVVGAILGTLGAALVCTSVALYIARVDQPLPCSAPSDPSPQFLGAMPIVIAAACVGVSQMLLAALYCLEETFLSRVKIETQFFMGLQGIFGAFFLCLCCIAVFNTPAHLSQDDSNLSALFRLSHEDVLQGFSLVVHSLPLAVSFGVIVAASCMSVVFCIITTQHATPSCRIVLELTRILLLWAFGVYLNSSSVAHKDWTLPAEAWSPQSVVLTLGLLVAAIAQAVYHRCGVFTRIPCVQDDRSLPLPSPFHIPFRAFDLSCFVYPTKWTLLELRDLHVLPQVCGFEEPWHLGDAAERWRVAHYRRQERDRASRNEVSKRRTVRFKPGPALYEFCVEQAKAWEADEDDEFMDGATQAAEVKRIRAGYYSRIGVNRGASPTFDVRGGEDALEGEGGDLRRPLLLPQRRSDE